MMGGDRAKTVADVEGAWVDAKFESELIARCRRGWDVPVMELSNEMLATYLRQKIGLAVVLTEARRRVAAGVLYDSALHAEELVEALRPFDREVVSSRVFAAPRETVFRAVIDRDVLARWWGPAGFTNRLEAFEPRAGGAWRFVMVGPDGAEYPTVSVFDEVAAPARIVFRHLEPGHRFRMTMTFDEAEGGTRLTWRMEFDSSEEVARVGAFVAGANEQNFDRLAAEVGTVSGERGK